MNRVPGLCRCPLHGAGSSARAESNASLYLTVLSAATRWGELTDRRGDAHAFYVRSTKYQTVDERRDIKTESRRAFEAFRRTLPGAVQQDRAEVCGGR